MHLHYTLFNTAFGWCAIAGGDRPCALVLPMPRAKDAERELLRLLPEARKRAHLFSPICRAIARYFAGQRVGFDFALDLSAGTLFQQQVWRAARRIPYGEVRTYGQLAEALGRGGAARAVGQALAKNPLPLLVPCHRVVKSNGALGGFSAASGAAMKEAMLRLERGEIRRPTRR